MTGEHIRGIPRTYEKEITLADTPYTLSVGYNSVKVDTTGGNVRVNLPNVNYPIDVIKTSSDSYIVTVWVGGTQIGEVAGELSKITIENAKVTKDEPWYPYDCIVGIAGVSGNGGEVLAKDRFGRVIAGGRGVAGTDDVTILNTALATVSGSSTYKKIKLSGLFVFPVDRYIEIYSKTYIDAHGSRFDIRALNSTYPIQPKVNHSDIILDGLYLYDDGGSYGIYWRNYVNNLRIKNSRFVDLIGYVINGGSSNMVAYMDDCYVSSSYNANKPLVYSSPASEIHIDNLLANHTIDNVVSLGRDSSCINSRFYDCAGYCIRSYYVDNNVISNNVFRWTYAPADVIYFTQAVLISGEADGGHSNNNVVENNRIIADAPGYEDLFGIYMHSYNYLQNNIVGARVSNNVVENIKYGVVVGYSLKNCILDKNVFSGCDWGMYVSAIDTDISENVFIDCTIGYADFDTGRINFHDNIFSGCGTNVANSDPNTKFKDNIGYPTDASGSSTGTGSEQTIAHNLAAIPTGCKAWITYLVGTRYVTEMIPFDATNVYPWVDNGVAYTWRIE